MVEHLSHANTFLFPLAVMKRMGERVFPPKDNQSDLAMDAGVFNDTLKIILSAEAPLVSSVGLPYGLSVIAIGIKRQA